MKVVLKVEIVGVIVNFADVYDDKVFDEIFPLDKENTVVTYVINVVAHFELVFRVHFRPECCVLVVEGTCPASISPRISNF